MNIATLERPKNAIGLSQTLQRPTLVLNRNWQPINRWATATEADLPVEVQSLIAYRNAESEEAQALIAGGLDNIRWDLLAYAAKGPKVWATLARKMGPQALRMNLNTLLRHGVFSVEQLSSIAQAASINDWDNRSTLTTLLTGLLTSRRFDDRSSSRTSTFQRT